MRHLLFLFAVLTFFACDPTVTTTNGTSTTTSTTTTDNTTTTQPASGSTTTTQPATGNNSTRTDVNSSGFSGKWVHSQEEDTDSHEVFRREGFNFPPARGRKFVLINEDKTVAYNKIAPNDAFAKTIGSWVGIDDSKFQIVLDDDHKTTINAVMADGQLKLQKQGLKK